MPNIDINQCQMIKESCGSDKLQEPAKERLFLHFYIISYFVEVGVKIIFYKSTFQEQHSTSKDT